MSGLKQTGERVLLEVNTKERAERGDPWIEAGSGITLVTAAKDALLRFDMGGEVWVRRTGTEAVFRFKVETHTVVSAVPLYSEEELAAYR